MKKIIYIFAGTAGEYQKQKYEESLNRIGFSVHPVRSLAELHQNDRPHLREAIFGGVQTDRAI